MCFCSIQLRASLARFSSGIFLIACGRNRFVQRVNRASEKLDTGSLRISTASCSERGSFADCRPAILRAPAEDADQLRAGLARKAADFGFGKCSPRPRVFLRLLENRRGDAVGLKFEHAAGLQHAPRFADVRGDDFGARHVLKDVSRQDQIELFVREDRKINAAGFVKLRVADSGETRARLANHFA